MTEPFMHDAARLIHHPETAAPQEVTRAAARSTAIIADRERGKLPAGLDGARASHPAANERYIGNEEPSIGEPLTTRSPCCSDAAMVFHSMMSAAASPMR